MTTDKEGHMALVGRVVVGDWKGSGADRHLEIKVYPTSTPVESASKKSDLLATDSVRLPDGMQLAVNLYKPKAK